MTKITIELSEEDYHLLQSDETQNDILEKLSELYEAEQNKIVPGDWVKMNDSGEILLCSELDDSDDLPEKGFYSEPDSNLWLPIKAATKLSPEAQDILNKETGKTKDIVQGGRVMTNKEKSEKIQKMFLENYDSIRKTIGGDSYTDIRDAHKLHLECVLKVLFPEDEEDRK